MVADWQTEHDASQSRHEQKPPGHSRQWWSSRAQPTFCDVTSDSHRHLRMNAAHARISRASSSSRTGSPDGKIRQPW
jgi:hypothetical protein